MRDGWTDVFQDPGKRTTGTGPQKLAITGPGWTGTLPNGVTEYKSPTGIVWMLGRIYCTGTPEDYKAVHTLQDKITVVPLSAYSKPYTPAPGVVDPSIDSKVAVREQVNAMNGASYFKLFAELLKTNPPLPGDEPMIAKLAKLAKLGIVLGQSIDMSKLDPAVAKGMADSAKPGQDKVIAWQKEGIVVGDMKLENAGSSAQKRACTARIIGSERWSPGLVSGPTAPRTPCIPSRKDPTSLRSTTVRTST